MKAKILLICIVVACYSCDSFLDERPKSALTPEDAYNSLTDLRNNAVLAIYNNIGGNKDSQGLQGTGRGVFDFNSLTTDEAIMPTRGGDWYDGGFWQTLYLHSWTPGTASLSDMWQYLFGSVMLCNDYLEKVKMYQVTHTDEVLDNYVAELRSVRALFYFYLMDLFGRVPLVTTTNVTTSELTLSDRSVVFRFITDELQKTIPLLAAEKSNIFGEYYGRMTRPVAWFLLAKLALNAEVYCDNRWTQKGRPVASTILFTHEGKKYNAWDFCTLCCDSVSNYGYRLERDFTANFSPTNEHSSENIFTIPMDPVRYKNWYCYFFRSRHYSHGAVLGGASENGTSATIDLCGAFKAETAQEDPRFRMTFYSGSVYENGHQVYEDDGKTPLVYLPYVVKLDLTGEPFEKTAGARLRKYTNDPNANADGRACNNDIVLFRYADVLLMEAEALVRSGHVSEAARPLNEVRARSGLNGISPTLDNILHERYLELAWEGWRRNDMVRFDIYKDAYGLRPQQPDEENGFTTVFPIPGAIIDMHPDWEQNPGY